MKIPLLRGADALLNGGEWYQCPRDISEDCWHDAVLEKHLMSSPAG